MASPSLPARALADHSRAFSDDSHRSSPPVRSSDSRPFYEGNIQRTSRESASQIGEQPSISSTNLQDAMLHSRSWLGDMESYSPSSSRRPFGETEDDYLARRTRSIAEAHRNILGRSRRRTDHARAFFERERNADHRRPFSEGLGSLGGHDHISRMAVSSEQSETVIPERLRMALPRYTPTADHPRQEQTRSAVVPSNWAMARYVSPFSSIGASSSRPDSGPSADRPSSSQSTNTAPSAMKRSFEERSGRHSRPISRLSSEAASSESQDAAAAAGGSRSLRIGRPNSRQGATREPWLSPCRGATPKRRRPESTSDLRASAALSPHQVASTSRDPMTATSFRSSSPSISGLASRMTSFPPALGLSSGDRVYSSVTPSPTASEDEPPFLVEDDGDSEVVDDHFDAPIAPLGITAQHTSNIQESSHSSMLLDGPPPRDWRLNRENGSSSSSQTTTIGDPRQTFIYQDFSQRLESLQTQIDAARAEVLRHQTAYQDLCELTSASSGSSQAQWHLNQTRVLLERSRDQLDRFRSLLSGRQTEPPGEAEAATGEIDSGIGSDEDRTTTSLGQGPPSLPLIRHNSPLVTPFTENGAIDERQRPDAESTHSHLHPPSFDSARWNAPRTRREQENVSLFSALPSERSSRPISDATSRSRLAAETLPARRSDLSHAGTRPFGRPLGYASGSDGGTSNSGDSSRARPPSRDRPSPSLRSQWPYSPFGTVPMLSAGSPGLRNEPLDFARLHSQEAAEIEDMQARISLEEERQERQQRDRFELTSSAPTHSLSEQNLSWSERNLAHIWRDFDDHSAGEVLARSRASGNEGHGGQLRNIMRGASDLDTSAAALQATSAHDRRSNDYQQMMDLLWPHPSGRRVQDSSPRMPAHRTPAGALSGDGRYGIDSTHGLDAPDSGRASVAAMARRSRFRFGHPATLTSRATTASEDRLRSAEPYYTDLINMRASRFGGRLATMTASTTSTTTSTMATTRATADRPEMERDDVDTLLRRLTVPAGLQEPFLGFMDESRSRVRRGASEATLEGLSVFSYESRYAHLLAERGNRQGSAERKGKARAMDEDPASQPLQGTDDAVIASSSSSSSAAASSSSSPSPSIASESAGPEQCPICLEEYEGHDKMAACWCEHEFHETCLKTWLRQTKSCPLCRSVEPGSGGSANDSGSGGGGGDGLRSASSSFARFFLPDFEV
ncbi:hypothetical protein BCV69DRAFT_297435 [Microstroma glucosiphilum]|uniref:RING-type E3 ubiquitin transferase n=1 Tax=Pseudomicrostroma glucosiphilum TaxID=1684307 RepID=A0A316UBA2_9BASI|nr:hypothetical protein BCV69DRAFT_297435 [Pseudomicrostroma glucosiphilum]PWN22134.1 hypothetical protein BCV69DRAFT_297435 [Pseudomicrostroma glucosiphilum]